MEKIKFKFGLIQERGGQYSSYVDLGFNTLYYPQVGDYKDAIRALVALKEQAKFGFEPDPEITFERKDYIHRA